ncbi:endonuclease domain-containing 1 protein-like [Ctenopharyngodon idella]|uniref:endonuclease domain-containing 1 protein-like n=1 Tax=Ctenopharyngodon idella TaxID=7959 RepID=UPI002231FB07|nr:endonuclease domain-containing 1 protein-like [Ctenopharyngodon idella]
MHLFVISVILALGFPFIMTEVVNSFSTCRQFFLDEQSPVIPGILNGSVSQDNNRYKLICQKYKNIYRFATLYDTKKKIPVFSAYKYTGHYTGRPRPRWMIEPQLETNGETNKEMREPCVNQAFTGDYWTQENLSRGHLFPNSHAADDITAESTFTMTNTVPQYNSFNNGSWRIMEENVRNVMDSHCRDKDNSTNILAYVLTGAVSSSANSLNKRVNIPSHMWTVFCCYNGTAWVSQAHWAENKESNVNTINAKSLDKFQSEFLQKKYGAGSVPFNGNCFKFLKKSE